ncbi:Cytochrome c oxidase assembly protein cox15 [Phytophthora boehmeriae]|uniref:Cytochrome c oxidase assembly protein cox15 n=1 Tax=Phytophthora boehmeriae TaxID=109152 RepID=A0A8T1VMC5_9STRA|nr:Cytochrome c oxidase assembly protein cox15 [Phytophthora boehmeriae]
MFAQAARRSAHFSATHSFAATRGSGLAGSRYQTLVKPVVAAPAKSAPLWTRVGLQTTKTSKQPLVYSTKARKFAASTATIENVAANRPLAYWIFGTAAMVGGMIAVGGATRLTRSGLSMATWKPHGGLPPMTLEEWEAEFEIYKQFPEYQQRKNMTVDDFKGIFWWEYGHRMLGRTVGMVYTLPLIYFGLRKRLPVELYTRFAVLFGLGAAQGGVGWWMVRSGLEDHGREQLQKKNEVRVSPYRLATHLGFAFTTLGVLLWTGFGLISPPSRAAMTREMISPDVLKQTTRIRKILGHVSTVLGYTIISGAFVAGIDAGMAFNTFPKMDDQWIPDDLFVLDPKYKNFFENVPLVQLDHRLLAMSTITGFGGVYAMARRPHIWKQLPQQSRTALNLSLAAATSQVLLGITTLLNCVPIPLAVSHQCGAIVLMTSTLWSQHTLNFAKPIKAAKAAIKAAPKVL